MFKRLLVISALMVIIKADVKVDLINKLYDRSIYGVKNLHLNLFDAHMVPILSKNPKVSQDKIMNLRNDISSAIEKIARETLQEAFSNFTEDEMSLILMSLDLEKNQLNAEKIKEYKKQIAQPEKALQKFEKIAKEYDEKQFNLIKEKIQDLTLNTLWSSI